MKRVKYYASNNFLFGRNLEKIETYEIPEYESVTINDAIEYFCIHKYFSSGARSKYWTEENHNQYKDKSNKLYSLSLRFFNNINTDNILNLHSELDRNYHPEFWELFDKCKLFKTITEDLFSQLISSKFSSPYDFLKYRNIVNTYGDSIRNSIIQSNNAVPLLLHIYELPYTDNTTLYLPSEFSGEDLCSCIDKFINSEHPNINYLEKIIQMQPSKIFPITDELRLKAKRKHNSELRHIQERGVSISYGIGIAFSSEQKEVKLNTSEGRNYSITYSTKWLLDTLDYPSILNNFIYVFEYCDICMRCSLVSHEYDAGIFELINRNKSSRIYPINHSFNFRNTLSLMQIHSYYSFLESNGIDLVNVVKWFFTEYLQEEYGCPELRVSFPTNNHTYAEKCYALLIALESILRQFELYSKHKEIDFELLSMSTKPVLFENIKSLIKGKYLYGLGDNYKAITHHLFSDQSLLAYVKRLPNGYTSFYDHIKHEKVYKNDYIEIEHPTLEYLCNHDIISIGDDGLIFFKDIKKVTLFYDLHKNEVACVKCYSSDFNSTIKDFVYNGYGEIKDTLLSTPEINYFNYILNRAEYDNGLELRNTYIHGIQQANTNEEAHKQNFYAILRILIILAIKINDDFYLYNVEQNQNKNIVNS